MRYSPRRTDNDPNGGLRRLANLNLGDKAISFDLPGVDGNHTI